MVYPCPSPVPSTVPTAEKGRLPAGLSFWKARVVMHLCPDTQQRAWLRPTHGAGPEKRAHGMLWTGDWKQGLGRAGPKGPSCSKKEGKEA